LGVLLLPPNAAWVYYMEMIGGQGPYVSTTSLFLNVVFLLVAIGLLNAVVRRRWPRLGLNRLELTTVYVMLTVGTSICSHDMLQVLLPLMSAGHWYATPQNRWDETVANTTPNWLVISDKSVLYGYFNGASTFYQRSVIEAWLTPAVWWSGFIVVLVFVLLCLSVVLRPLWADRERLSFPIIHLPLELTNPDTRLLRNGLLWLGFAIAFGVDLVGGLNYLYPSVPHIPLRVDISLPDAPWSGIGWLPMTFNPSLIGLCFLMPLDLLFSCVFFFFYWKGLYVLSTALGFSQGYEEGMPHSLFPYVNEQMFGGFIAIAFASMVLGRRYFQQAWMRVLGRPSEIDDSREGMSFRTAAVGAVVGLALLIWFSLRGGMSLGYATTTFVIYFLLAIAVARVRAEFGSPVHDFHKTGPDYVLSYVIGTQNISQRNLGMMTQLFWFNRAYRAHPVAQTLEGLQMAARVRAQGRRMTLAILLALVVATVTGFWVWLHYAYQVGAWGYSSGEYYSREIYNRLQSWVENPRGGNPFALVGMGLGFATTMLLAAARSSFASWPLNPVAFALSASWSIHLVWMPMLIAWLLKVAVLRYGGLPFYRRALPFFFGLILGESIMGCAWPLIGLVFKVPSWNFFGT
jgi:hypothetical protein